MECESTLIQIFFLAFVVVVVTKIWILSQTVVTRTDRFESLLSVRARSALEIFMKLENNIQNKNFFSYCSRMLLLIRDRLQQNIQKIKSYIWSRTSDSNFRFQWIRIHFSLSLSKECSHCPSWKNVLTVTFERMFPLSLLKEYFHRPFWMLLMCVIEG